MDDEMKRFRVKAADQHCTGIGVVQVEMIVVAESEAEAQMYVEQIFNRPSDACTYDFLGTCTEIPTGNE